MNRLLTVLHPPLSMLLSPFLCLILLAGSVASFAGQLPFNKENPLVIGLDMDYAPLEYVNEDGMPSGLDVDFTRELMQRLGVAYTYQPNSWENISGDVINGRVDLGMMVYSPYRKDIVNYSRAVFRLYYQIVYRKTDKLRFDVRNLGGKEIAYMSSRPITDTLTRVGAVLNVVDDLHKAMNELDGGRYDAVICFRYQAKYIIAHYGLKNLDSYDLTLTPREYCYVSRDKAIIEAINPILEQMENDGTINRIYGDDVTSQFGSFRIPQWVYVAVALLAIAFLVVLLLLQHRHHKQLQREVERALRSERMKTVFLGNVSHALRTPLNAVIGFSEVLQMAGENGIPYEERKQLFGLIHDNGQQLLHFINELLLLSNFESSRVELNIVECDLAEQMADYGRQIAPRLHPGVQLHIDSTPMVVRMDPGLMRTVMMHLLENSAKHTLSGSIGVRYRKERGGLYVEVADTGCGLPESLKDNIFGLLSEKNTFVQSETPGLGLSICKAIVEMSKGQIGVGASSAAGTTIWIWVPKVIE